MKVGGLNGVSHETGACFLLKQTNKQKTMYRCLATCCRSSADVTNPVFCFQGNQHTESKKTSSDPPKTISAFGGSDDASRIGAEMSKYAAKVKNKT